MRAGDQKLKYNLEWPMAECNENSMSVCVWGPVVHNIDCLMPGVQVSYTHNIQMEIPHS